jgi:hypothetical protein
MTSSIEEGLAAIVTALSANATSLNQRLDTLASKLDAIQSDLLPASQASVLFGQSLTDVTVTGPGTRLAFDKPKKWFAMHFVTAGNPSSAAVSLEGSIDGSNFVSLSSSSSSGAPAHNTTPIPMMFIRANCLALSGGSEPILSAWVAASD